MNACRSGVRRLLLNSLVAGGSRAMTRASPLLDPQAEAPSANTSASAMFLVAR